jgi:hypothetical protein
VDDVAAAENSMVAEDRIARLETDVCELKGDVRALDARVTESIIANAKEHGELKAEMEKGFGALKTSIESAKLWKLVTGVGSVILVTFVSFLGRALCLQGPTG